MRFSQTFISRPIFATVLALVFVIIGGVAYFALPVAQYPEIAPPTVVVSANYPGANAETVAATVAAVIEQEVNGVENMLYMTSQSTADGAMSLTVTFALGTDLDKAQVLVQNRVGLAAPRLPEEVRRLGVTVRKNSPDLLMVIHMISTSERYDQLYLSNYALLQVQDTLARIGGVGGIRIFGGRDYSMRVWLDPNRLAAVGMTSQEAVAAISAQNVQVAGGTLAEPPVQTDQAFQIKLQLLGRLTRPEEFGEIVIRTGADGRVVRLKDVARVELGALSYLTNGYLDGQRAVVIAVTQLPGSNALTTARGVQDAMAEMAKGFPQGIEHKIIYNPTDFIAKSIDELITTIFEAVLLVVVVVLVFLQSWRATIIPVLAIPVSLIGTFAAMAALGYSINNLTLFGLVLAVGIVVDDAIVVVENVERKMHEGMSAMDASRATMREVGGALVSIALVLCAVFVPTAFLGGISGQFYQQFAVTIAVATVISAFNSLTLSPALCAILFDRTPAPRGRFSPMRILDGLAWAFNAGFDAVARGYGHLVRGLSRVAVLVLMVYAGLIGLTYHYFTGMPTGFIPAQDQGFFIVAFQLPPGASLARTDEVVKRVEKEILSIPGFAHTASFSGFSGATFTNASNAGAIFAVLDDYAERTNNGQSADKLLAALRAKIGAIQDALIFAIPPPPVRGVGTAGGFSLYVQDRGGRGLPALAQSTFELMMAANQTPGLSSVFTSFFINTPQLYVDVDRVRAQMLNVPMENVFETLRINLGSAYVNDFNLFGRTFRVTAQADQQYRMREEDIARLKVRSAGGAMVPMGSLVTFRTTAGPDRVPRFNLYPAAELNGTTLPGVSSGEGMRKMEELAARVLPEGLGIAWTGLSYQERLVGNTAVWIFALSVLFVYLALAAQYESWSLPFAIILIVPMCLLSAIGGLKLHGMDVNILTQIGFVVLIGLAAKNAILIVEFARQLEDQGRTRVEAAVEASRLRLRPILMTSFAFTLGVLPLYLATGAGAEMRQALGTAVFYGMLGVTFFGVIFTPVFYVVIRGLFPGRAAGAGQPSPMPAE
jgi:hydrophobe/amphiphile efflux-1 (HAE1) family protein